MGTVRTALKGIAAEAAAAAVVLANTTAERLQTVAWRAPSVRYINGASWDNYLDQLGNQSSAELWRKQPHLRTVVDFLARNVAQLGLHVYTKTADGGRARASYDHPLVGTLDYVDGDMTTYDLVYATIGDFMLYDRAYWWLTASTDSPSGKTIRRLPPSWVSANPDASSVWRIGAYDVSLGGKVYTLPAMRDGADTGVLRLGGYAPDDYMGCAPKVQALKDTLAEQVEATKYRSQVWKRGGRVSAVIERPADADPWSDTARDAFREDWYAKFTGNGPAAGGTPILEDGMKLQRIDFNAREQQFVEASRLSLATVCGVYHVNPTMVGATEGATYSNVREFSRMLYTDTLGPLLKQLSQRINKHLVPALGYTPDTYVEFNIQEKLAGSFEEQAGVLQASVGGPWMTRNEARARQNLPALDGGDELIVPLNVVEGGQAGPNDTGTQNEVPGSPDRATAAPRPTAKALEAPKDEPATKARRQREAATDQVQAVLQAYFKRQLAALRTSKAETPEWDDERWNTELTNDLLGVSQSIGLAAALAALKANGLDADAYDEPRTRAYLRESSARKAEAINEGTKARLAEEHDDDTDMLTKVLGDEAAGRAKTWGAVVAGFVVGWSTMEAARQNGAKRATKTWHTTSRDPRSSHMRLDGVTVPIGKAFPNGLEWPGAFGDPDQVAGCKCEVTVSW